MLKKLFILTICYLCLLAAPTAQKDGELTFMQDVAFVHTSKQALPEGAVSEISLMDGKPVISLSGKLMQYNGSIWESYSGSLEISKGKTFTPPASGGALLTQVEYKGAIYLGCENGLYKTDSKGKKFEAIYPADENYSWAPRVVTGLAVDTKDRLWVGMKEGLARFDGSSWKLFTGKEGLPYNEFTCAISGPDGEVWFGTERGAIRAEDDYFFYRATRRWLPNDYVNDIAVDKDGTAWIATANGVSQISSLEMTYEEKADHFIRQVEERHNRMGFVCQSDLQVEFDLSSSRTNISDNDGLYTSWYGAAMAYKYAATGDPKARELAVRSFYACKWLVDITHESGFPARVIIPVDWRDPVNEQHSPEFNKARQKNDPFWKDIYPRFPLSKDKKYRWKCDTSSDELSGHYFFYAIFYDLVAETEQEKADARQVVADITDHLIRHGFKLVDHDGKPTRWANFNPEYFNSEWGWEQRGLNSMVLLSFLNVASHMTGDSKYEDVARMLREKHDYHINSMHAKEFFPPENAVAHDNNISLMSFYGLMNYEKDPELLIMYRNALENMWLHISKQKNPFWDGLYGALANSFSQKIGEGFFEGKELFPENPLFKDAALRRFAKGNMKPEYMVETLQRTPLDLIGYPMDNTHRLDVILDATPGQKEGMGWRSTDQLALPIDERGHVRLDRDAFAIKYTEVFGGRAENEGSFYLLPYYLARYHNLIEY